MKKYLWFVPLALSLFSCTPGPEKISFTGAGASFPAPLYQKLFFEYNKQNPEIQVTYQSVGSGAGVEQFIKGTVDFGASDVAMKDEEISKVDRGTILLPVTAGSVVLAYNLPGIDNLNLSRQVYVDILLGKIKKWNHPLIVKDNPEINLPDKEITVVFRSDGSGTTGVFTKHLNSISKEWSSVVGEGKTVEWPTGIGAKGNEGVTAQILQTEGTLGYIEFGYAKIQNIPVASLENNFGNFIEPTIETTKKALSSITLPENLRAFEPDPKGEYSYPIVTFSWILAYKDENKNPEELKEIFDYMVTDGQSFSEELGYIPLPKNVVSKVQEKLGDIK